LVDCHELKYLDSANLNRGCEKERFMEGHYLWILTTQANNFNNNSLHFMKSEGYNEKREFTLFLFSSKREA